MIWKITTAFFAVILALMLLALPDNVSWLGDPYQPTTEEDIEPHRQAILDQADRLKPGVVTLSSSKGFGSGFIVHKDGYIFTNAHVVGDIANWSINTYDGSDYSAQVVARADQRKLDLAILKTDSKMENITVLDFANSSKVEEGDIAFNIGSPGKFYNWAILAGEVIEVNEREIHVDKPGGVGESGSPLFNLEGDIIGIVARAGIPHDEWEALDSADDIVVWNENLHQYSTRPFAEVEKSERLYRFTKKELGKELADNIFKLSGS